MTVSSYSSVYSSLMSPTSNISKDIISQNDKDSDSLLSFDELDMEEEQFSAIDTDSDGLLSQNEIATAIDYHLIVAVEKCLLKKILKVYFLVLVLICQNHHQAHKQMILVLW